MNDVDAWFVSKRPPAEAALRLVREIILRADPRMTEYVKYGTVQFAFGGDMANFVPEDRRLPRGCHVFGRGVRLSSHIGGRNR